jgi:hypothetical protein
MQTPIKTDLLELPSTLKVMVLVATLLPMTPLPSNMLWMMLIGQEVAQFMLPPDGIYFAEC